MSEVAHDAPTNETPVQGELPLAFIDGEPLTDVPEDLYIPPDALAVILETFEGPLDLLLYLIRRQNMDILAIDVFQITRQYMEYVDAAMSVNFALASDYLVMAAMLAEIKSKMLLPKPELLDEEEDPRAELIRRLREYERFKIATDSIEKLPRDERDFAVVHREAPREERPEAVAQVSLSELVEALNRVLESSKLKQSHNIAKERLSTRERMSQILERLSTQTFHPFESLFTQDEGREGVIVSFMALMELLKLQLLELVQSGPFAPIRVRAL